MIKYLFYLSVLLLSLGQFVIIQGRGETPVYLFDLSIAALFLFGIIYFLQRGELFVSFYNFLLVVFCVVCGFSLILSFYLYTPSQVFHASLYLVRLAVYVGAALVLANVARARQISIKQVIIAFVLSGVFVSVLGFIQLIFLPDFAALNPLLGWDPHKNRLASTFFDPNFAGAYIVLCFVLSLALEKMSWTRCAQLIMLLAVFLTFSRSTWAMLAVVTLVYGLIKDRRLLLVALLTAFLAYFFVPRVQTRFAGITDPADSARFRLVSWKNAIVVWKEKPVFGVGFNAYKYAQKDLGLISIDELGVRSSSGADSSLLFVLATTGVLGLAMFIAVWVYPLFNKSKYDVYTIAIIGSLLLESQFINSLFYPQILFLWLTFFSLVCLSNRSFSHS